MELSPADIQKLIRLTYFGLSDGALLALIALGFVLVYKATDVINFAHAELMLLGAFVGYQMLEWFVPLLNTQLALDPAIANPAAIIISIILMTLVMIVFGILIERFILRPMIGEPIISVIMVTIGINNIIQALVGGIWGKLPRALPIELIDVPGRFEIVIEGARRPLFLSHERLVAVVIVFALTAILLAFFRYSRYGIAMRAAADDQQAAMSMGISIKLVFALTWSLAAVTAGFAGLLIAELSAGVSSDLVATGQRVFPVIILGGLDSIAGAIIGGLLIGLVEQFTSGFIDASLKSVMPYIVLLVILLIRPYGLFGQKIIERV